MVSLFCQTLFSIELRCLRVENEIGTETQRTAIVDYARGQCSQCCIHRIYFNLTVLFMT